MQACSQIALLAIVTIACLSFVDWRIESSPLLPVGDASTSAANKEIENADVQHRKRGTYHHYDDEIRAKIAKYSCIHKSLKFIFAKVSMILETLKFSVSRIIDTFCL